MHEVVVMIVKNCSVLGQIPPSFNSLQALHAHCFGPLSLSSPAVSSLFPADDSTSSRLNSQASDSSTSVGTGNIAENTDQIEEMDEKMLNEVCDSDDEDWS